MLSLELDPLQQARLHRWALILETDPKTWVRSFREIQSLDPDVRRALTASCSALDIAYQDAGMRAEGLAGASIGDAEEFFGLALVDLEGVLSPSEPLARASDVAKRIRSAARWSSPGRRLVRQYGAIAFSLVAGGGLWLGLVLQLI